MPDFELASSEGQRLLASSYRGRCSLVLLLIGDQSADPCRDLLSDLARRYRELLQHHAEVLAIVQGSIQDADRLKRSEKLPFPVLADEGQRIKNAFGAHDQDGNPAVAIYVTDRYGEIQLACRTGQGDPLPTFEEVLDWLRFIEIQCPE